MKRRLVAVVLLGCLLGTSCGGGSAGDAVATNQATDAPSADGAETSQEIADQAASDQAVDAGAQDGPSMAASSPLGAFFADDGGFDAAIAEYRLQVRESILVCMAAQGFEFVATDAGSTNEVQERQNDMTIREWTSEFGFGISTSFSSVIDNLATNPNVAIFQSLGAAERELWALTLNGVGVAALAGSGNQVDNSRPLEDQGCIGQALIETGGQEAIEGLGDFGDTYDEGEAALFERREVVEAVTAWSRCMSEAGFPSFAGLEDPEEAVRTQFTEVTAPIRPALAEFNEEEGQAFFSGESVDTDALPGLNVDALRDVQAFERELALADLDCYQAEVQAIYEPLRDEFENGLLAEYATEFAAVKNLGS